MKIRASLLISAVAFILLAVFLVGIIRSFAPFFLEEDRRALIEMMPVVKALIESKLNEPGSALKLGRVGNADLTILNAAGAVEQTTIAALPRGVNANFSLGQSTVFETVFIDDAPVYALSSPISINGEAKRIVLSRSNTLTEEFLARVFGAGVMTLLFGLLLALGIGSYLAHYERTVLGGLKQAFRRLGEKEYDARIPDDVGGKDFAAARESFHGFLDQLKQTEKSTIDAGRAKLHGGEEEKQALRAALFAAGEGIFIIDRLGKIIAFNGRMETLSGYSADEALNKVLTNLLVFSDGQSGALLTGLMTRILATGTAEVFPARTFLKKKNGETVPVTVKTVPVKNELRNISHVVALVTPLAETEAEPETETESEEKKIETAASEKADSAPDQREAVEPEAVPEIEAVSEPEPVKPSPEPPEARLEVAEAIPETAEPPAANQLLESSLHRHEGPIVSQVEEVMQENEEGSLAQIKYIEHATPPSNDEETPAETPAA